MRIGDYELVRCLDVAGSGERSIWLGQLADARGTPDPVVIKRIPVYAPRRLDRVIADALNSTMLKPHANIVATLGVHDQDGQLWVVQEYAQGRTVEELSQSQRLTVPMIARIALQAIKALEGAHGAPDPVAHGALKPDKLIVDATGNLKVLDFGLASTSEAAETALAADVRDLGAILRHLLIAPFAVAPVQARAQAGEELAAVVEQMLQPDGQTPRDLFLRILEAGAAAADASAEESLGRLVSEFAQAAHPTPVDEMKTEKVAAGHRIALNLPPPEAPPRLRPGAAAAPMASPAKVEVTLPELADGPEAASRQRRRRTDKLPPDVLQTVSGRAHQASKAAKLKVARAAKAKVRRRRWILAAAVAGALSVVALLLLMLR